jgi:hypothetical protein
MWTAATPCAPNVLPVFFPLDEELELLPGELSATLAEGVARLGTKMPFEQAFAELASFWGVELDQTTVRRHTQAAGAAYVAEQAARRRAPGARAASGASWTHSPVPERRRCHGTAGGWPV